MRNTRRRSTGATRIDVESRLRTAGTTRRANDPEYSCFPQNETALAINPVAPNNIIGGANDYRNGFGGSGFYATTDNGRTWYDGVKAFPGGTPNGDDHLDGGGDPAIAYDRQGMAYYADIHFYRTDLTNGVFVGRSLNGGFTWSKPCIAQSAAATTTDQNAVCGGNGDPRIPNDGTVAFYQDDGTGLAYADDRQGVRHHRTAPRGRLADVLHAGLEDPDRRRIGGLPKRHHRDQTPRT